MSGRSLVPVLCLLALAPRGARGEDAKPTAPLLPGITGIHHPVSTKDEMAQRYVDQGMVLAWGFNHEEAERSFLEAARRDPDCAMAYWGAAWVLGPNINAAMDTAVVARAWEWLQKARALADHASPRERAYIEALSKRYAPTVQADRTPLDQAFADAMKQVAADDPQDMDAAVIAAEALMDLHAWDYWERDANRTPKTWTPEMVDRLEAVLRTAPNHPGANHLYIHIVESSSAPERGLASASRLRELVPGAGHLVHMPSHIYIRTGDYREGTLANQRAVASDQAYLTACRSQGVYALAYHPHNHHFLWATATLEGRSELAGKAATNTAALVDADMMRVPALSALQHFFVIPLFSYVRFGQWTEALAASEPDSDLYYPRGVWHYARGMAYARTKRPDEAQGELDALKRMAARPEIQEQTIWGINKMVDVLDVGSHALAGEIAAARGKYDEAIAALRKAVELEDALRYNEPSDWFYPARHTLGAVLLDAGQAAEAEAVYRADLAILPRNGWSLRGLAESLHRQEKHAEGDRADAEFNEAWVWADIKIRSSRF